MKKLLMLTCSILMCSFISYATNETDKDTLGDSTSADVSSAEQKAPIVDLTNTTLVILDEVEVPKGIPQETLQSFECISFPEEARALNEEGSVCVCFTYTEDGYIKILSTNASNENFKNCIIEELKKIRLSNGTVTVGKEYLTKFDFRIL